MTQSDNEIPVEKWFLLNSNASGYTLREGYTYPHDDGQCNEFCLHYKGNDIHCGECDRNMGLSVDEHTYYGIEQDYYEEKTVILDEKALFRDLAKKQTTKLDQWIIK